MPMAFDNESIRLMVDSAQDQRAAISNIAEMAGITEDEVKRIAYDRPKKPCHSYENQCHSYDWIYYDRIIINRRRQGASWRKIAAEVNIPYSTIFRRWGRKLKARAEEKEKPHNSAV